MKSRILSSIQASNLDKKEVWINEAIFGYTHIKPYCDQLHNGSDILEIGCGSGILLNLLNESFNNLAFHGIEPFGDGFGALRDYHQLKNAGFANIDLVGFEDFQPNRKFDLIYCINVFEHLPDWKLSLDKTQHWLNDDGKLVILCPNYNFPYESHFRLPIIINKKITYAIFNSYIQNYEKLNDSKGLWDSLNFIKKKAVKSYIAKSSQLKMDDKTEIIHKILGRLKDDSEFRKRQNLVGLIALLMIKIRIIKIIDLAPNYLPYMHLEFQCVDKLIQE